jgi:hypothetical protein
LRRFWRPRFCIRAAGRTARRSEAGCPRPDEFGPRDSFGCLFTAAASRPLCARVAATVQAGWQGLLVWPRPWDQSLFARAQQPDRAPEQGRWASCARGVSAWRCPGARARSSASSRAVMLL